MKAVVILYCIVVLLNWPVDSRQCYQCTCQYESETNLGSCVEATFGSSCVLAEVGNQYCLITSTYSGTYEERIFGSIATNNLQDSHFLQAIETISLSGGVWLPTAINSIGYGCDWDGCNNVSLAQYLPDSFQMRIDETVLNSELIGGQSSAQACYLCSACINSLTAIPCQQVACTNGICFIDEIHNYITTAANNCTYNFFSYCASLTDFDQTPSVRIRATYYIDFPEATQLEIDEVDIRSTKNNSNSIIVVENLKGQIQRTVNIPPEFQPFRPIVTTPGSKSARSYPIGVLYLVLTLLLL